MKTVTLQRACDHWVEAGDERSNSERRTGQASRAGAGARRTNRGSARARANLRPKNSYAAAGSVLHHAEGHAQDRSSRLGTQHVGVGNVQVVARDGDVEIVLERQR